MAAQNSKSTKENTSKSFKQATAKPKTLFGDVTASTSNLLEQKENSQNGCDVSLTKGESHNKNEVGPSEEQVAPKKVLI